MMNRTAFPRLPPAELMGIRAQKKPEQDGIVLTFSQNYPQHLLQFSQE
jgi:hypothetical protein